MLSSGNPIKTETTVLGGPADHVEADAIKQSIQEFPQVQSLGFYGFVDRGPILPPYGSRERQRQLRIMYHHDYDTLIQGAFSGLIKKIAATPWEIKGDQKDAAYFQDIFQEAHFGYGWKTFLSRFLTDYLTQDTGAVMEVIGGGHPSEPLVGPIQGIAHLDVGRCYFTGNPIYPVLYYSLMTFKLHQIHTSRMLRFVDMPDPDERLYGAGLCALSRAIAVASRQILASRYIESFLDDKPKPGLMLFDGLTRQRWSEIMATYQNDQSADQSPLWGRTMFVHNIDKENPLRVTSMPFAQTPEKFDWIQYTNLDVNAIALALGVDKQELWELTGGTLGSGAQSEILAQKAKGKGFADILNNLERMLNLLLPEGLHFEFKVEDAQQDLQQAQADKVVVDIATSMKQLAVFSDDQIRLFLSQRSKSFGDVLVQASGQVALPDVDRLTPQQELAHPPSVPDKPAEMPIRPTESGNLPGATPQEPVSKAFKNFAETSARFVMSFVNAVTLAIKPKPDIRERFGQPPAKPILNAVALKALLRRDLLTDGAKAFNDGKQDSGVYEGQLDEDERAQVLQWLSEQSGYLDDFVDSVMQGNVTLDQLPSRATMWVNKALHIMYDAGRYSADRNAMYKWQLGRTDEHCEDCVRLNNQVHRFKEWFVRGWLPKSDRLACHGFNCGCSLMRVTEPASGRF